MRKQTPLSRWLKLFFLGFSLLFFTINPSQNILARSRGEFRPGELLIQIDPLSGATMDEINASFGTTTLLVFPLNPPVYLLQIPAGEDVEAFAEQMEADIRILYAEPNFVGQTPEAHKRGIWAWGGPDTTPYGNQYAVDVLHLDEAHLLSQGAGVTVAVIDTGVQLDHPALINSLTTNGFDFVDGDTVPYDEFTVIDDEIVPGAAGGHGTHVAGVVHLVAPDAQIMPIRILTPDGSGDVGILILAIKYAVDNGANVINLSLGMSQKSDSLEAVTRYATQNGVFVVAAAGNLGTQKKEYPAAAQCTMAVTSVGPGGIKTDFANYGKWITFAVPGEGIYSTFPVSGYAWWGGTSMASPFVAGQAALLYSIDSTLSPRDVALLIASTSTSLDDVNPNFQGKLGAGQPDMEASLVELLNGNIPSSNKGIMSDSCIEDDD